MSLCFAASLITIPPIKSLRGGLVTRCGWPAGDAGIPPQLTHYRPNLNLLGFRVFFEPNPPPSTPSLWGSARGARTALLRSTPTTPSLWGRRARRAWAFWATACNICVGSQSARGAQACADGGRRVRPLGFLVRIALGRGMFAILRVVHWPRFGPGGVYDPEVCFFASALAGRCL